MPDYESEAWQAYLHVRQEVEHDVERGMMRIGKDNVMRKMDYFDEIERRLNNLIANYNRYRLKDEKNIAKYKDDPQYKEIIPQWETDRAWASEMVWMIRNYRDQERFRKDFGLAVVLVKSNA